MPDVACVRCFAIFHAEDARPGTAPVCPACAKVLGAAVPAAPAAAVPEPSRRRILLGVCAGAAVLVALAAAAVAAGWIVL